MNRRGLFVALFLLASPALAAAANWPRFQGPNGSGTANEKNIPVAWTPADFAWKVPLPGHGRSSPIVWDDRVFLQSASEDGTKRFLLCLSLADGKQLWATEVPGARAPTNKKNSLASSTPATDGERVYALFWDGKRVALYAFDFNGKALWHHDLGAYVSQHGAGNSPIVHGGKVFLLNDHDAGASLVALDGKTGAVAWAAPREHVRACYSTPFLLERPNEGVELIVGTTSAITSYNPQTGEKNWEYGRKFPGMRLRTVAAPVLAGGLIIASSGDGKGDRNTVGVVPGSKAQGSAPTLAWSTDRRTMPYVPNFLSQGDHVFWVNDKGFAGCSLARSGEVVWSERLGGKDVTSSPVLIDGKVYVADEGGTVFVFAAQGQFKLLAKTPLGEEVLASPAVADGRLLIRGEKHLFCIGKGKK